MCDFIDCGDFVKYLEIKNPRELKGINDPLNLTSKPHTFGDSKTLRYNLASFQIHLLYFRATLYAWHQAVRT